MVKLVGIFLLTLLSVQAFGQSTVQVDRYTSVRLGATEVQRDPLKAVVQLRFPAVVLNTRQAIDYVLDDSGYSLVDYELWSPAMNIMLDNPISIVHRDMSNTPMTLRDVLGVLSGEAFRVVQDPLRRKVSFVLKDEYRGLVGGMSSD
ncbi:hypothetical protein WE348_22945 (plasmid) [Alteromonas macleodii]|uniref:PFGI-1 class ICE element type IV pilus protein PilL2 n=1 Tax=Alteromonas macleodii TaxID=28108 RepID=UPI0030CDEA81